MHDYPNLMTIMRMRGKSRKDCAKAIGCNRTTLYKKLRGQADWRLQECLPAGRAGCTGGGPVAGGCKPPGNTPEGVSSRAWPTARGCAAGPRKRAGGGQGTACHARGPARCGRRLCLQRTPTRSRPERAQRGRSARPPTKPPLYK